MEYIANAADCGKFREVFEDAARKQITTRSPEKLLKWLEATDFYTAPASTRFHGAYEGGLCVHSVNVFRRLSQMRNHTDAIKDIETAAVCGLFHDVCKANFYKTEYRNVKNEQTGKRKERLHPRRCRMIELNRIEKAISEIIGTNYGECQCHRETMVQAVEALREQAERSKGCVWCKEDNKVFHDGQHFHFFCSYCGKRLKVEP